MSEDPEQVIRAILSVQQAMEARVGAENLAGEVARLESALEGARGGLMAAAGAVEARVRRHAELTEHVRQANEAWSGQVRRARRDYQVA